MARKQTDNSSNTDITNSTDGTNTIAKTEKRIVKKDGKQLDVWIPVELHGYVAQRAEREHRGMNQVIADLVRQEMAREHEAVFEHQTLGVLQELVAAELRQAHAQLRRDLRSDREQEAEAQRDWFHRQVDRLAGLMVMAVRSSSIARRLTYVLISKAYGPPFAKLSYDNAKEKAHQELLPKKAPHDHVLIEDDERTS